MSSVSVDNYKLCLLLIKYVPITCVLVQILYLILYIIGYNFEILIHISGMSVIPIIMIYNIAKIFKYCMIQKLIILYNTVVDLLISLDVNLYFTMLIIGISLILFIGYKFIISKITIRQ